MPINGGKHRPLPVLRTSPEVQTYRPPRVEFPPRSAGQLGLLHEQPETLSMGRYLTSSSFGQAVMENWQSKPVGAPHHATAEEG